MLLDPPNFLVLDNRPTISIFDEGHADRSLSQFGHDAVRAGDRFSARSATACWSSAANQAGAEARYRSGSARR
jgi:hypothetical protein